MSCINEDIEALITAYYDLADRCCVPATTARGLLDPSPCLMLIPGQVYQAVQTLLAGGVAGCGTLVEDPSYPEPDMSAPCTTGAMLDAERNWIENIDCTSEDEDTGCDDCDPAHDSTYVVTFGGLTGNLAAFNGSHTVTRVGSEYVAEGICAWADTPSDPYCAHISLIWYPPVTTVWPIRPGHWYASVSYFVDCYEAHPEDEQSLYDGPESVPCDPVGTYTPDPQYGHGTCEVTES